LCYSQGSAGNGYGRKMIIVNFILFMLCVCTFIGFVASALLGAPWLSFFFAVLFCILYYAFRLDHTKESKPKEIILTYRNGDLPKEQQEDGDIMGLPDFDRNNWKFN
jgi:uncharacterized membrane protein